MWDDEAGGCCSGRLGGVECGAVEMVNGMRSSEREKRKKKHRKNGRRCDGGETQLKKKRNGTYGAVYTKLIHPDPSEGNEATDVV